MKKTFVLTIQFLILSAYSKGDFIHFIKDSKSLLQFAGCAVTAIFAPQFVKNLYVKNVSKQYDKEGLIKTNLLDASWPQLSQLVAEVERNDKHEDKFILRNIDFTEKSLQGMKSYNLSVQGVGEYDINSKAYTKLEENHNQRIKKDVINQNVELLLLLENCIRKFGSMEEKKEDINKNTIEKKLNDELAKYLEDLDKRLTNSIESNTDFKTLHDFIQTKFYQKSDMLREKAFCVGSTLFHDKKDNLFNAIKFQFFNTLNVSTHDYGIILSLLSLFIMVCGLFEKDKIIPEAFEFLFGSIFASALLGYIFSQL